MTTANFKAERDTIAGLGLLTSHYLRFDPPFEFEGKLLHSHGFNVHCLIIDNVDGEVLALNRNSIHADQNPLQHAEQVAVRDAIERLNQKYPRILGTSIDDHIRRKMFMAPGTAEQDFVDKGCTLYNTFDPCGFCAVTLLVCYMKRIAYLFDDKKFDGVYEHMRQYFRNRESVKEPIALVSGASNPLVDGALLITQLRKTVLDLETSGVPLVQTLDSQLEALKKAASLFTSLRPEHLTATGNDHQRNLRTIEGIKRICNLA